MGRLRCSVYLAVCLGLAAAACSPTPDPGTPETRSATVTPTAFPTQPATATAAPVQLWPSPALPQVLRQDVVELAQDHPAEFVLAGEREGADVRLEPFPEVELASWVYALVAPFPTVEDSVSEAQLRAAWSGEGGFELLAQGHVWAALEARYGPGGVDPAPADADLIDLAWDQSSAWAVVPFEQLKPRWKVLHLEASSPVERNFDAASYPLRVPFGASGDPAAVEQVVASLDWPASNRDSERLTVVTLTGVTALTRATAWAIELNGIDWAIGEIEPWFRGSDMVHISHEVPFATDCPPVNPSRDISRFCGQPQQIELLERLGADVVELTGNHVMDWGPGAFLYTLDAYHSRGWLTFGGGEDLEAAWQPARIEHNGNRLAFLGCNSAGPAYAWATEDGPGATPCDPDRLHTSIAALREQGYLPIVTFQWAESYRRWPLPPQQEGFRAAADAGAVIVSGSQAHQAQGFEFHNSSFIHYGPGNLFFDQMWSLETRQEFIVRYVFYDGAHISTELKTALLEEYARPRPMSVDERSEFLGEIFSASGW